MIMSNKKILNILFMTVLCIVILLPFMWVFSTSLRLPKESFKMPPSFFPTDFYIQNYIAVFQSFPFARFILNSLIVCVVAGILNILVTSMAAYAFSRLQFVGRDFIFKTFLIGIMIPMQAIIIPQYLVISTLGFSGTLWALILPAIITPLAIFLVRQHMLTIPKSYDEAAYMDGASHFVVFTRLMLPMSKPVIVVTTLINFFANWNNFLGPLIYLSDWNTMTLPIGLRLLTGYQGTGSTGVIFAGLFISIIPPLLLYIFGQKYLVEGVTMTGLKS